MNNCDVQYRQSSNKRLLVELTLIQVGQITQPEDQDVPSAGRTPHRLKSLFQKIVAQLKPVAQGAGAGQDGSSNTPIAAATASPTPNSQTTQSQQSQDQPGKATATSVRKVNFSGIGMTFSNLKKNEEREHRTFNPIDKLKEEHTPASNAQDMNHSFTQEQVEGQWINMCMRMQNIKELIGLANRMKAVTPTITNFPNIEVVVDNQLLLNDILNIKNRIRPTFVQGLRNNQIQIDYRIAKADEIKKVLSKREVFDNIMDSNPAFKKMVSVFNLALT